MSLDVYLEGKTETVKCMCPDCSHEHTREVTEEIFWANITHNLAAMAGEANIYKCLWRPEEVGITKAAQLVEPLRAGLTLLRSEPDRFKKHNPSNGWGSYDAFLPWVDRYLDACERYPDATIRVSR